MLITVLQSSPTMVIANLHLPNSTPTMVFTNLPSNDDYHRIQSSPSRVFANLHSPNSIPTMVVTNLPSNDDYHRIQSSPTMLIAISNASIDDIRHQINCLFTHQFICPIPPFYYIYNRLFSGDVCLTTACTGTNLCSSFVTSVSWHITICSDQPWVPIKASLSKN